MQNANCKSAGSSRRDSGQFSIFSFLFSIPLFALFLLAGTARAADIYVSTNGLQQNSYANWTDAFTNLQAALDYSAVPANAVATIYLAGQTFSTPTNGADATSLYVWQNATNVALRGGYRADPVLDATPPGLRDAGTYPTAMRRTTASGNRRVLRMAGVSNAVIEQVTIREGQQGTQYAHGSGLFVTNSQAVTISDCSILFNTNVAAYSLGAGVGVQRSDVVLTNCTVANNYNDMQYSGAAGLYVDPASRVTMVRSFLRGNRQGGTGGNTSYGAGFYNQGNLRMFETVVATNVSYANNAYAGGGYNTGFLLMQNCLVVSNKYNSTGYADGIHLAGGTGVFVNCTIVSNAAVGIQYGAGAVAMTNCIAWGHSSADLLSLPKDANGVMTNVWYSDIGDGQNNGYQGCLKTDPLFVDSTYYHLKSTVSNYTGGYFTGGSWGASATTSPLIDRGVPPPFDYSREPAPNGSWVNIGYDGNTEVASESPSVTVVAPTVQNDGAATVGHRSALLRGEVTATGGELPLAGFRYWPVGGATNQIAAGYASGYFERTATGLIPGTTYGYLVYGTNSAGESVSAVSNFTTHPSPSYLYVATNGDNTAGTNWATAYQAVQTALNLAETNDTIFLAGHTFVGGISGTVPGHPNNAFLIWRNATNITVKGGYDAANGGGSNPGTRNAVTELKRTVGSGVRVLSMIGVTNCTLEQIAIRDGSAGTMRGVGVYLTNCWAVTFANCTITNNGGSAIIAGAGLYAHYSGLTLTNSLIVNNQQIGDLDHGTFSSDIGGGICAANASSVTVVRCTISGNQGDSTGWESSGGGFTVRPGGWLGLYETILARNINANTRSSAGAAGANLGGMLLMRNCLVSYNTNQLAYASRADGLLQRSGTTTVINCTFATNNTVGLRYVGGTFSMTNCIVWGHSSNDMVNFPQNGGGIMTNVFYSSIGTTPNNAGDPNQHCVTPLEGPRFADWTWFHLASMVSNYSGGYFTGGTWTTSQVHSALIDAGDTNSPYSREPAPNGSCVNMGYDGNTEVASMTLVMPSSPPAVTNLGALYWGHRTVTLYGQIVSNGYPNPQGFFRYWQVGSGTTSETVRAVQTAGFSTPVTGLTPGQSYQFVAVASNSSAEVVSDVKAFATHPTPSYLYVSASGNDTAGTNWVTAYSTVQRAMDLAESGDTIYLAGQTFSGGVDPAVYPHPNNAFLIWRNATNVTVRGGYDAVSGGGSNPGARNAVTELKRTGNAGVRVLTMIGATNCTIEQVTIRDGSNTDGAGVYLTNCASVTLANCIVTNHTAGGGISGIGLRLQRSSVILTNTTVVRCYDTGTAWYEYGGGAYVDSLSRMTAVRSTFAQNGFPAGTGNGSTGPAFDSAGVVELYECVLYGNQGGLATTAGAVLNSGGLLSMRNCLLYSNSCARAGTDAAIEFGGGTATVVNCTIAYNFTNGLRYSSGSVGVTNCIIWGHTTADATNFPAGSIGYSALAVPNLNGQNGCITNNPLFAGAATNNYALQAASACIDTGSNQAWMAGALDLAGNARQRFGGVAGTFVDPIVDMGAYEAAPPTPVLSLNTTVIGFGTVITNKSPTNSYTVSGTYLPSNVTVRAPANFLVATNGTPSWYSSLTLTPSAAGVLAVTPINVQFTPPIGGTYSGVITNSSYGATDTNVTVSGLGVVQTLYAGPTSLAFGTAITNRSPAAQTYTLSGTNLDANVTVTAPTGFQISTNGTDFTAGSVMLVPTVGLITDVAGATLTNTTVTVRFAPATPGSYSSSVTNRSLGASNQLVAVTGTGVVQTLSASPSALTFGTAITNRSPAAQPYTVSGTNLDDTVTVTAPAGFQVSTNGTDFAGSVTLVPTEGLITDAAGATLPETTVSVRFRPAAAGAYSSSVTNRTAGAMGTVGVDGLGVVQTVNVNPGSLGFGNVIVWNSSTNQSYQVSGSNLEAGVTVTAPAGFEISTNGSAFGSAVALDPTTGDTNAVDGAALADTTVYVRFAPTLEEVYSTNIANASTGAVTKPVTVTGTGVGIGGSVFMFR